MLHFLGINVGSLQVEYVMVKSKFFFLMVLIALVCCTVNGYFQNLRSKVMTVQKSPTKNQLPTKLIPQPNTKTRIISRKYCIIFKFLV